MTRRKAWMTIFVLLLLVLIPSVNAQQQGNPIPIQYGQTLNGQLAGSQDYHFYTFQGNAGDQITITVTSTVDTFVQLGDPNANVLAENDDSVPNSNLNPRLDYTLSAAGTYLIGVGGYSAGSYSLTLVSANAPVQQPSSGGGAIPIQYGMSLTGQATALESPVFYSFFGNAGDNISIILESTEIDTYLQLGDANAKLIAENDDVTPNINLNARIDFTLPSSGNYLIGATGYTAGSYTLTLLGPGGQQAPPPQQNQNPPPQQGQSGQQQGGQVPVLQYGDSVTGDAIDMDNPIVYVFSGSAGDNVVVDVTSSAIDPFVVITDASFNSLGENDDISTDDLNSHLEVNLPANGDYYIGVFGYSSGSYTLSLSTGAAGTIPVSQQPTGDVFTGEINNDNPYVEFPIPAVPAGGRIIVDVQATGGDLDSYLGLFYGDTLVAENDDREQGVLDARIEYPGADAGDYSVVVTRYGFQDGETSGTFQVAIDVVGGGVVSAPPNTQGSTPNPSANGYPTMNTTTTADWTILAYLGGDNNLEDGLLNDMNEFELAGGSDEHVRVLVLMDRTPGYDDSNGDWTDVRIYEMGPDTSNDHGFGTTPTIDSMPIADLGELDTSYGNNLTDFLVWGITNYPARNYAVSLNDHGGAWLGIVSDDTTGHGILSIPTLQQSFETALRVTNTPKFALLINDACLMASVEYSTAMAPYFDYILSSPEITLNPSFDMDLLTRTLKQNPTIPVADLGKLMIDKYVQDMNDIAPDMVAVLGGAVLDTRGMPTLTQAVEDFANVVNANPSAYASMLGQARSNTYTYSFFLPEDQFGPATNIDLGDFMRRVARISNDPQLTAAAQNVLNAISGVVVYSNSGDQLGAASSFFNVYFPASGTDFIPNYFDDNPIGSWSQMLRGYYGAVNPGGGFRAIGAATPAPTISPSAAPSVIPQVTVTNVFPQETSVNFPTLVSMELVGRNIAFGDFTVDQLQPDGSALRLDTARIVTEVVVDGVVDHQNLWEPGVDDFDFTWEVELTVLTDGTTENFELVTTQDGVSSMAGRYRYPGSDTWQEVTVIFDGNGNTESVVGRDSGVGALASIQLAPGGEFQSYRNLVTPDGRIITEPGTTYAWTPDGVRFFSRPAPSGQYNLGFLIQAFGGATGFASTPVTVNNDNVKADLSGYVDFDWGFRMLYPSEWFDVSYFPDADWLQTSDLDTNEYFFVYPAYDATDAQSTFDAIVANYSIDLQSDPVPTTVAGKPGLEFTLSYLSNERPFQGRAVAVYNDDVGIGLVFSAESFEGQNLDTLYDTLVSNLEFYDLAGMRAADTGAWEYQFFGDHIRLPLPRNWSPVDIAPWTRYVPDGDASSRVFAASFETPGTDPDALLTNLLNQFVLNQPGAQITGQETYFGENLTWSTALFQYGDVMGRMHVTVDANTGTAYALWFEAPAADAVDAARRIFDPVLDGYKILDN